VLCCCAGQQSDKWFPRSVPTAIVRALLHRYLLSFASDQQQPLPTNPIQRVHHHFYLFLSSFFAYTIFIIGNIDQSLYSSAVQCTYSTTHIQQLILLLRERGL